ncbi:MAG TPA: HAMP domain-containing histidine kinase [Clostridiaceae bacterium]|nr:HAMP domain-containing histidine kinase [Clostridiaceae bacterium]
MIIKIRGRLMLYFSIALITLSFVISSLFFVIFSRFNSEHHRGELIECANRISDIVAQVVFDNPQTDQVIEIDQNNQNNLTNSTDPDNSDNSNNLHKPNNPNSSYHKNQKLNPVSSNQQNAQMRGQYKAGGIGHGLGNYMNVPDNLIQGDYWLVDQEMALITRGNEQSELNLSELPEGSILLIQQALDGNEAYGEDLSTFLGNRTMTAAVPIMISDGSIKGAVLLHEPIQNINDTSRQALGILLISMPTALLISFVLAAIFSKNLSDPLRKLAKSADKIGKGDYLERSNIKRNDEIGDLATSFDQMASDLQIANQNKIEAEQRRQNFLANISHELRTPITVMRASLEALADGIVTEDKTIDEYYRQMLNESKYLERLVSDLLELSRLQDPDFSIQCENIDLREICQDALNGMRTLAAEKSIKLNFEQKGSNFSMSGDYTRLRQMIVIILDNAIKFSPENETIDLLLNSTDQKISMKIQDHGSGIPPEDLPFIFERFHKQTSEENKKGSGLGLAIAQEIAKRHGLEISAESSAGKGSLFIIETASEKQL